ncbi:hypothetical protein [Nocardia sp. CDC160]|uniref:hypothetical protein n=1 Tax=Nocardia sp. CDC160 TaxID=3112166 RepID=UPI002DBA35E7|nr:hypothetical protein [Nocardia sp. CDC160]MEC3916155.1 hypothetical protein [Nocardia sp. CDC160]
MTRLGTDLRAVRPDVFGTRSAAADRAPVLAEARGTLASPPMESVVRVRKSSSRGGLASALETVVRLGGPLWFESGLITQLDAFTQSAGPADRIGATP